MKNITLLFSILALIGATLLFIASFFPTLFPSLSQTVDADYNYKIVGQVKINKAVYTPCEAVSISFVRRSNVVSDARLHKMLIRFTNDVGEIVDVQIVKDVSIERGTDQVEIEYKLPCTLRDGRYMVRRVLFGKVNGVDWAYQYETPEFRVEKDRQ